MLHTFTILNDAGGDTTQMDWDMLVEEKALVPFYRHHLTTTNVLDLLLDVGGKTEEEVIQMLLEDTTKEDAVPYIITNFLKDLDLEFNDYNIEMHSVDIIDELKYVLEMGEDVITDLLKCVGYEVSTVGYSDWITVVYERTLDFNWIKSMYDGYDYYDLAYTNDEGEEEYRSLGYVPYMLEDVDCIIDQLTDIVPIMNGDTFEIEQEVFSSKTELLLLEQLIAYSKSQPMRVVQEPIFELEQVEYQAEVGVRSLEEKIAHWELLGETNNVETLTFARDLLKQVLHLLD